MARKSISGYRTFMKGDRVSAIARGVPCHARYHVQVVRLIPAFVFKLCSAYSYISHRVNFTKGKILRFHQSDNFEKPLLPVERQKSPGDFASSLLVVNIARHIQRPCATRK